MNTESTIIIRARKALAEQKFIDIQIPKGIDLVLFRFMSGRVEKIIWTWDRTCWKRGLVDIKLYVNENENKNENISLIGYNSPTVSIVCFWKDGRVTQFSFIGHPFGYNGVLEFKESVFQGDVQSLLHTPDNTEEWKKNLADLEALANRIGESYYAERFALAKQLLEHTFDADHSGAPYYVQDLPNEMKDIMFARNIAWVFGGMGSWNDDPKGEAYEIGLGTEYDRLSQELLSHRIKALQYVTNECYANVH